MTELTATAETPEFRISLPNLPPLASVANAALARPILLLQGFGCASNVMLPIGRKLRAGLARPVTRPGGPVQLFQDIRGAARQANAIVEMLAARRGFEFIDIVGHSMGGLVASYLLKYLDAGRHVRRVVTLGTPHRGTPIAVPGVALFGFANRALWQMVPGSSLLSELAAAPLPLGSELISIGGGGDRVVPEARTRIPSTRGQRNIAVANSRHIDLLISSHVSRQVIDLLAAPDAIRAPRSHATSLGVAA